jgi:amino acid adenylation domain-containing protein
MLNQIQGFRLSPQQRRLWLLRGRQGSAYHARCAVSVEGAADAPSLREALKRCVERHEILRTIFPQAAGMKFPVQAVAEEAGLDWREEDLRGLDAARRQARLEELFEAAGARDFDLERGPLVAATLATLSDAGRVLILSLPALCSDGPGLKNLVREIGRACAGLARGEETADDAVQYADLSEWQNELFESEDAETGREFWRRLDVTAPLGLRLPSERQTAAQPSASPSAFEVRRLELPIPAALSASAASLAASQGVTDAELLLTCWQVLLSRLTGRREVGVGVLFDGRDYEELEGALGPLSKCLPVPALLEEGAAFTDAVARVSAASREAGRWQESFGWEQAEDGAARGVAFFPFCFEFDERQPLAEEGGPALSILRQYACTDRFKVKLSAARSGETLLAEFHYDAALFGAEEIALLAGQFRRLLESAVAAPRALLRDLEIVSEDERRRWLVEFNRTERAYPSDVCVQQLFEEQVAKTPESVAASFGGESLTYQELNARANLLARYLRSLGVGPDVLVGLHAARSLEMLVGVLGVLKAGGAYVPLDPQYPAERLAYMIGDARPAVVLTQQSLEASLPACEALLLSLDGEWESPAVDGEENLPAVARPENLAYVIYTSGSTGRPKGVMIPHGGLVNYLSWCLQNYVGAGGGAPVHSPLGFDLTVTSLFCPLLTGQEVALLDERRGIDALSEALRARDGFGLVKITPAHLEALNQTVPAGEAAGRVGTFVIGGEALLAESLNFWRAHAPATRLVNEYGPTETVVGCCVYEVAAADAAAGVVPIGRPIFNTQIYLLDERLRVVPVGVAGELYVGGAGVARGYLNRPDLTAEKFIPDPFSTEQGARLYRTGDVARYLSSGEIEFLGRVDHQVKLRGFRIELGEIEAALASHAEVAECAAMVREDAPGDRRLVAYVVARPGSEPGAGDLRSFLADRLPDYMIPSAFVALGAMPLTANGKIDRRRLPAPDSATSAAGRAYVAPRNAVEEVLAGIWAEVLGAERVGVEDNFFDLGGHSLLATQVVSRVRDAFKVELMMSSLFEAQTPATLAEVVERARREGDEEAASPIARVPRGADLPLSFAQRRLWFIDKLEPGASTYNLPYAVRLRGRLDAGALEQSLAEVVRRHESLRTTFSLGSGEPAQAVAEPVPLPLPQTDLSGLPEAEREAEAQRLAAEEAQRPFDLEAGPLMRAALLRLAEDDHVLLLTMHHIVSDGWSMGVVVREVGALYSAFSEGRESPLAELPIQYADYAAWQREHLSGATLERQLAYWRGQLTGVAALELPTDRPRPAVQTYNGAQRSFALPADLSAALTALNRREGVTLYMTMLAAFQALLYRYSGQEDISVGSPVAGRNRAELEGLIGFFVNTLVLRTDLGGNPTFEELLGRVREVALGAYEHQDVPFERLVEELQPERELSRNPLFQVMFEVQNATDDAVSLPGLALSPLGVENKTAKFDLTLLVEEGGEGLSAKFEYSTDLFDASTVERMGRHFQTLLAAMIADPSARVADVPLLTADEREQLAAWNDTRQTFPLDKCFTQLFEEQAARTPGAAAAGFEGQTLTYAELNARANKLAHHLRTLGVGPEVPVGVFMPRGLDLLVGMLAIFKAGGVYVPLDPAYPKDRLAYIMADSQVSVLLSLGSVVERLPEYGPPVVRVDDDAAAFEGASAENPAPASLPENLAYVIYTSGSTGRPKGAMVEHRGMLNHLCAKVLDLQLTDADVLAQNASQCFDISVWQFLSALLVGGRVEVFGDEVAHSPARLSEACARARVSVLELVPSLLRGALEVVAADGALRGNLSALRWLLVTGEALPPELCRRWLELYPEIPLLNAYGPTECSDDVTHHVISESPETARVPVGRPVANMRIHILDKGLRPLPVGIAGELCVAGVGVGRGYLDRPDLTAERFIPDPFSAEPGARLYRTGDLARYLAGGEIEFLGRIDHQVKLRGFRIELGEIEAALERHVAVDEAVVLVSEPAPGEGRLVAYVVADGEPAPGPEELRAHLRAALPEYMIPPAFVTLEKMPLTANGKVDRNALARLEAAAAVEPRAYVAPRNAVEEALAGVWAELLGVERVGVEDNFFELGGHSLMAIQVSTRLLRTFKVDLPLRSFFEAPTVAGLAERLVAAEAEPGQIEKIARVVKKLGGMSAEQKKEILRQRKIERGEA